MLRVAALASLCLWSAVAHGQPAVARPGEVVPGHLIVHHHAQAASRLRAAWRSARALGAGITLVDLSASLSADLFTALSTGASAGLAARGSSVQDAMDAAAAVLRADPDVVLVEPDRIRRAHAVPPNDPLFPSQWSFPSQL